MVVNPFQSGQQFELQQATQEQALLERLRRERGINALAGMFGETALAPTARTAVLGTERAEKAFTAKEEQRVLENQRQAVLDQRAQQEADLERRTGAALNVVGFLEQGFENNVPFELLRQTASTTLLALGQDPKETEEILEAISRDPTNVLAQLRAALASARKPGAQERFGRLTAARVGGKDVFVQGSSRGGFRLLDEIAPPTPAIQRDRLRIAQEKITADLAEKLELSKARGKALGKAKGEIIAEDLPTSRTDIALQRSKIRSMTSTTDRALNALDNAKGKVGALSTGFIGGVLKFLPGTPSFKLVERLLPVVSQEFVTNLQNMRDLSKTGGAVGNVSNAEGDKLQAVNASLNIGVGRKQLLEQMEVMREAILTSRRNLEQAFQDDQDARKALKEGPQRFIFNRETGQVEPK